MVVDVSGMTCGHCENAVKTAIRKIAPEATVDVDLGAGRVTVTNGPTRQELQDAINQAGFKTTQTVSESGCLGL